MQKIDKYCPNGVFLNPDYVEDLFNQLTTVDREKLLNKLCNCYSHDVTVDWRDALDNVSDDDIVEYIGEINLLESIDNDIIIEYVEDNGLC